MSGGGILLKTAQLGVVATAALLIPGQSSSLSSRPPALPSPTVSWLQIDTDACGDVNRIEDHRSAARTIRADEPDLGDDEDEWVNAWNMSPGESVQLNDWMTEHPEIATVTSAVEKSCDGDVAPDDGDTLDDEEPATLEIA